MSGLGLCQLFPVQTSLLSLSDFGRTSVLSSDRHRRLTSSSLGHHTLQVSAAAAQDNRRIVQPGKRKRSRLFIQSDGKEHLGSALERQPNRPFPGPPPGEGPPLRILPVGGLGEIGMNCMLVGVYDRYILIDAGLMFPDFSDLGMNKILPDTTFLAEWKDKIEAVIITHGHEDHIGALPWVLPALDPNTPIFAGAFTMQLVRRRLQEFSLFNEHRFRTFKMRDQFQAGPFEIQPLRVTHSIPDCCGLILRSEHGSIVHTGDWKIEEDPVDGQQFDRTIFEDIGKEGATLFMSDSTNVLSPGRTTSEASVEQRIMQRVMGHQGKGRVIATQFASNIHRLAAVKKAADAANRKICFVGMSLNTYLEAAASEGQAPFHPRDLIPVAELESHDPNEVLIVTTGSQAEPRAALCLASREASPILKLSSTDLLLYSAKIIPGNDTKVMSMMNNVSALGVDIAMGASEGLHTSGHAYRDELEEVMKLVKPQHFLPVHGEYAFLTAHAQLAQDVGIRNTSVIRNGQMLGVHHRRNGNVVSTTGASVKGMQLLGDVKLRMLYNDGNKGTGSDEEMGIEERQQLAMEGIVVAAVDIMRVGVTGRPPLDQSTSSASDLTPPVRPSQLKAQIRVTTRAMWVDNGRLLELLHKVSNAAVMRLPGDASLVAVERAVADAIRRACKDFNQRRPDVVVIAHEMDPREGAAARASLLRRKTAQAAKQAPRQQYEPQQSSQPRAQQQHQQRPGQQYQSYQQQEQQRRRQVPYQQSRQQPFVQQQQSQLQSKQHQPQPEQESELQAQEQEAERPEVEQHQVPAPENRTAQSSQEDSSSQPVSLQKKRGRPRKADSAMASHDSPDANSSEVDDGKAALPVKRRGRPPKNASSSGASAGKLSEANPDMLQQRTAANPRETAQLGDDVAYD